MKRKSKAQIGKFIPRQWLIKAMQHWAKEVGKVERKKNKEINKLKEKIKELEENTNE